MTYAISHINAKNYNNQISYSIIMSADGKKILIVLAKLLIDESCFSAMEN